jgi:serine O-acetyltransferase
LKIAGDMKRYKELIDYDEKINAAFRGQIRLSGRQRKEYEWKSIKTYRMFQCNRGTFIGKIYKWRLLQLEKKTGIHFESNPNIGKGLIIGHWGRIIFNGEAQFGDDLLITHGVTIGRDIRGKRKGVPSIGNRVCIRANSTVVGNVTIGDDVLIAPNTFVNFDVPSHSIVIGNPASIHHKDNATEKHIPSV